MLKRIASDIAALRESGYIILGPDGETGWELGSAAAASQRSGRVEFSTWLRGREGTPYANGHFRVAVQLIVDATDQVRSFPFRSPSVRFATPIYHPNVQVPGGSVCVNALSDARSAASAHSADTWRPAMRLAYVFEGILPQLLANPEPSSPLNEDAAAELLQSQQAERRAARLERRLARVMQRIARSAQRPQDLSAPATKTAQGATRARTAPAEHLASRASASGAGSRDAASTSHFDALVQSYAAWDSDSDELLSSSDSSDSDSSDSSDSSSDGSNGSSSSCDGAPRAGADAEKHASVRARNVLAALRRQEAAMTAELAALRAEATLYDLHVKQYVQRYASFVPSAAEPMPRSHEAVRAEDCCTDLPQHVVNSILRTMAEAEADGESDEIEESEDGEVRDTAVTVSAPVANQSRRELPQQRDRRSDRGVPRARREGAAQEPLHRAAPAMASEAAPASQERTSQAQIGDAVPASASGSGSSGSSRGSPWHTSVPETSSERLSGRRRHRNE